MGNIQSRRRRRRHPTPPPPQQQEANTNYYFAPRLPHYPNTLLPPYLQYPQQSPSLRHEKAVSIRNDVNIKKDTLRMEPDQHNPHHFLVTFTFDAIAPGWYPQFLYFYFFVLTPSTLAWCGNIMNSITVMFFAKETLDGKLIAVKKSLLKQISIPFQQGLCQKFRQHSGTGIEISMLEETGLTKEGDTEVYPLVLKAEARPLNHYENEGNPSSQITMASFGKRERGEYKVQVMKQVLWVNGKRYELQEIYGIGNVSDGDGHESGGDCVICLSEPRDITVLPCRHMCKCSGCAILLKVHRGNCPICRHPVERLLEIKVNNGYGDQ